MSRAQTAYAKTQVQLANYEYMLPRLSGMWTHLERQRGGTGTRGGAGEREIETDRRIIRNRHRQTQGGSARKSTVRWPCSARNRGSMIRVGAGRLYQRRQIDADEPDLEKRGVSPRTNSSPRSTRRFARWSSTTCRSCFRIRSDSSANCPTELIESFKSTLDEVREADLLVHVVDISHPQFEEQIDVVKQDACRISARATNPSIWSSTRSMPIPMSRRTKTTSRPPRARICRSTT